MTGNILKNENVEMLVAALAFRGFWYVISLVLGFSMAPEIFSHYSKAVMEMQVGGIFFAGGFYQVISIKAASSTREQIAQELYANCIALMLLILILAVCAVIFIYLFLNGLSIPMTIPSWWVLGLSYSLLLTMQGYYARVSQFRILMVFNILTVLISLASSLLLVKYYGYSGAVFGVFAGLMAGVIALSIHSKIYNARITIANVYHLFIDIKFRSIGVLVNNALLPLSLLTCAYFLAINGDPNQVGMLYFSYSIFALTLFAPNAFTAKDIAQSIDEKEKSGLCQLKFLRIKIVRNLMLFGAVVFCLAVLASLIYIFGNSEMLQRSWLTSLAFLIVGIIFCIQLPITTCLYQKGKDRYLLSASVFWFMFVVGLSMFLHIRTAFMVGLVYALGYSIYLVIVTHAINKERMEIQ